MKQAELKRFFEAGDVDSVVLMRVLDTGWEVWAYDHGEWNTVKTFGNRLTGVKGEPRVYTSLDRAWEALRKLGWSGIIEIDG